jgi:hypothetical protein
MNIKATDLLFDVDWSPSMFELDLQDVGSLPELSVKFGAGTDWAHVHFAILMSGVRWECEVDGLRVDAMLPTSELCDVLQRKSVLLKVRVGAVQFNSHYFAIDGADFDVPVATLGSRSDFECLVAFMEWLAVAAGGEVRLSPEGTSGAVILSRDVLPETHVELACDRLRVRDLKQAEFGSYRDVVAPLFRLDESNIDGWLHNHEPDSVTAVLSHVHLWDEVKSTNDETVLDAVAQQIAANWRETLGRQFPERLFEVGVAGEPEEYGPTIWLHSISLTDGGERDGHIHSV